MEKKVRCRVCGRKDTLIEVRADGQRAMQCTNCSWLDPESIQNVEDKNIAGDAGVINSV